jgi:hypothetical protein
VKPTGRPFFFGRALPAVSFYHIATPFLGGRVPRNMEKVKKD